jgi:flagellar protein FlbT
MALKIMLKPHERLILGGAVVQNSGIRCDLLVENNVPILREKDILRENEADTPCKWIYFTIQLMYVDEKNLTEHHKLYWDLVRDVAAAAPSRKEQLLEISEHIIARRYYQALKVTKKLIEYEQEAINNVRHSTPGL